MDRKIFETGPIRPPFHADSMLFRVTENCTWNQCNFCTLYRGGKFRTRPMEILMKEIDHIAYWQEKIMEHHLGNFEFDMDGVMSQYHSLSDMQEKECYAMIFNWAQRDKMKTVFLQDANTMVLKPQKIAEIVSYIKKRLPMVELIAAYGRVDTLEKITQEEFHMLKEAGLNMLHSGFESGCSEVLQLLNKGCTPEQQIRGGLKAKEANIEFNVFYMPGAGGREWSKKNAVDTAEVISAINPDFIRIRTFVVKPGSPMWEMEKQGIFKECTDIEKVIELKEMIGQIRNCNGYIISDHIINLLARVEGYLDKDQKNILEYMDAFLTLPPVKQRQFQLARRMGFGGDFNQLEFIGEEDLQRIVEKESTVRENSQWEELLRKYLRNYI